MHKAVTASNNMDVNSDQAITCNADGLISRKLSIKTSKLSCQKAPIIDYLSVIASRRLCRTDADDSRLTLTIILPPKPKRWEFC